MYKLAIVRPRKYTYLHKYFVELQNFSNEGVIQSVRVVRLGLDNEQAKEFVAQYVKRHPINAVVYANGKQKTV